MRIFLAASLAALLAAGVIVRTPQASQEAAVKINVASTFATSLPLIGDGLRNLAGKVARATGNQMTLVLHEPGALVPAAESVTAVADGRVDAAWAGAGWFASRDSAFNFFSTVPFGPDIGEYLAWMYDGGGLELARDLFHRQGVHNIPCLLIPPEASGWFSKEIRSLDDLKGLRMRFFGLGAKVMQRLGLQTVQLPPGDIRKAFEGGTIDAAEFSLPVIDLPLELDKVAKYYYFPGWHQQATFFDLYIHKARWDKLSSEHKEIIELACGDTIRQMIAVGEARQGAALQQLRERGVQIRRWSPEILIAFDNAWQAVIAEESAKSPAFQHIYESYQRFRSDYSFWKYMGYLQ